LAAKVIALIYGSDQDAINRVNTLRKEFTAKTQKVYSSATEFMRILTPTDDIFEKFIESLAEFRNATNEMNIEFMKRILKQMELSSQSWL
jgi:hypothetical protein